ncbi:hypothetical protein SAMN04488505_101231 [Chitinophaga rupis]|uniref:Uncharacterized protein n=1 Tax=Chitinophaga rupis TaxID=573321 RepID=A0A1H7H590_9BACT|nr:DUF6686 family protein [Chitinophaga rupis]SEK45461.1 hypothetical protein SAMN04488505_101231 [Chitinophaga rupis]
MCETRILSRKGQMRIGHCVHCKTVFLWHGNVLLHFTPNDFVQFSETLGHREFCDHSLPFPDDEERVIIHTPCQDISFTFTKAEWETLRAAVEEALLMQQVYALI